MTDEEEIEMTKIFIVVGIGDMVRRDDHSGVPSHSQRHILALDWVAFPRRSSLYPNPPFPLFSNISF